MNNGVLSMQMYSVSTWKNNRDRDRIATVFQENFATKGSNKNDRIYPIKTYRERLPNLKSLKFPASSSLSIACIQSLAFLQKHYLKLYI